METLHKFSNKWTLWAHLPHDTDWTINSYINIYTFNYVEELITIIENFPSGFIENCMLFFMREGIQPIYEDPQNYNGGCFSYKIINKQVSHIWCNLSYLVAGETIGNTTFFSNKVTGITISPKKNFCIIKIWMSDCLCQNPKDINIDSELNPMGALFKKHI